jgi:hypothetical protein
VCGIALFINMACGDGILYLPFRFLRQSCLFALATCVPLVFDSLIDLGKADALSGVSQWCLYVSIIVPCALIYWQLEKGSLSGGGSLFTGEDFNVRYFC